MSVKKLFESLPEHELYTLDAARLPDVFRRFPCAQVMAQGKTISPHLVAQAFSTACAFLGTEKLIAPLKLPFNIIGDADIEAASLAIEMESYSPAEASLVLGSAERWMEGERPDALDALWNHDGLQVYGFASLESRKRASAFSMHENITDYCARSLKSSLLCDLANSSFKSKYSESNTAIVIEPSEIIFSIPKWPHDCFGIILIDEEYSWWNYEYSSSEDINNILSGRNIWPPRDGNNSMLSLLADDEISFVLEWFSEANSRPVPRRPINYGHPDDNVDW